MFVLFGVVKYEGETLLGIFETVEKAEAGKRFAEENPSEFDYGGYFEIREYQTNQMEYYYFRENEDEEFPIDELRIEKF